MIDAHDLRIDAEAAEPRPRGSEGQPPVDGLSFSAKKTRTLVLGAPRELMLACAGLLPIVRGELAIDDVPPPVALARGTIVAAPLDAPMPPAWTPLRYVEWSMRLAGVPHGEVASRAREALERVGIVGPVLKTPTRRQPRLVRRATQLAAALVPAHALLVLSNPLEDLEPEGAALLGGALAHVLADRRALVFAGRVPLAGPVATAMDEAIVIERSRVVAQGAPRDIAARGRTFRVRAIGDLERFAAAIEARGCRVVRRDGRGEELAIELGSAENVEIFRAAASVGAVVVEMRPSFAMFS